MKRLGWTRLKLRYDGNVRWHYAKGTAEQRMKRIEISRDMEGALFVNADAGRAGGEGPRHVEVPDIPLL